MILSAEGMTPVAIAMGLRFVLDPLIKGFVLLLVTHLALKSVRGLSPHWRSSVWTVLLVLLVVLPTTVTLTPRLTAPLVTVLEPFPGNTEPIIDSRENASSLTGLEPQGPRDNTLIPTSTPNSSPIPWWMISGGVWMIGTILFASRTGWRLLRAQKALSDAEETRNFRLLKLLKEAGGDQAWRPIKLLLSPSLPTPFAAGFRHPCVVLPRAAVHWADHELIAVLRHELAHLKRHDLWRLLFAELACAVHWPNPLVWIAAKKAALAHEMASDALAAHAEGSDPREYARVLLAMATSLQLPAQSMPNPGLAHPHQIETRLRGVLAPRSSRWTSITRHRWTGLLGLFLVALMFSIPSTVISTVRVIPEDWVQIDPTLPVFVAEKKSALKVSGDIFKLISQGQKAGSLALLEARPELLETRNSQGMTPLALAVWNDQYNIVTALLAMGANPDTPNANGLTPIFTALDRGRGAMARLLTRGGADLHGRSYRNWTLLHAASRIGESSIVRILLAEGLDVNAVSSLGRTPLHMAQRLGFTETINILLEAGARDFPNPHPWPETPDKPGTQYR